MWPSKRQISRLLELEKLCYPEAMAYDTQVMREFLEATGAILVCEWRNGILAGFQLNDREHAAIITIDVRPDFQRQGIGKLLMRRSLELLRLAGVKQVSSQTAVDNVPSLMLHLKFGFQIRQRLKHYYSTGWDAYLLVLKF